MRYSAMGDLIGYSRLFSEYAVPIAERPLGHFMACSAI